MRTTLTIDDPIIARLKETAATSGKSFKQVVNETLRTGLDRRVTEPATQYRLSPTPLGQPQAGINLDKALDLADKLENSDISDELERGR